MESPAPQRIAEAICTEAHATHHALRLTTVGWIVLALVIGAGLPLLIGNNLVNLIEGRPLHAHPN